MGINRNTSRTNRPYALIAVLGALVISGCDNSPSAQSEEPNESADRYSLIRGATLSVEAPGVLENDDATPDTIAKLASRAKYGKVEMQEDGSFRYEPNWRFPGTDSFVYQTVNGGNISEPITVTITRPNIVLIMVDDLGQGDVGIYNPRDDVSTPNIDALANSGMYFTNAHSTAAVCSPTRYSLMTGNYPWRGTTAVGIYNSYEPETMIPRGQLTLGNLFDRSGYNTAFFGKLHNGGAFHSATQQGYTRNHSDADFTKAFDRGPTQFGFDYSFVLPAGISGSPYAYFENDRLVRLNDSTGRFETFSDNAKAHSYFQHIKKVWNGEYNGGHTGSPGYAMDNYDSREIGNIITGKVLEYIDTAGKDTGAPFFIYYGLPQIHRPHTPPAEFQRGNQAVAGVTHNIRTDAIHEVDLITGAIVDALEESGTLDDTLIIFTSDNGPFMWLETQNMNMQGIENGIPLRGAKSSPHEGGHRVPLIAYWGDALSKQVDIDKGTASTTLIGLHDLASTFNALLGKQREQAQFNDSKSFLPVITGSAASDSQVRDHLFADGSPFSTQQRRIINRAFYQFDDQGNRWKIIANSSTTDPLAELTFTELYNLSEDPAEENNLINQIGSVAIYDSMSAAYKSLTAKLRTIDSPE